MSEKRVEVQELTLEEVMGDRFGRYSKYIIQERALPDIRDGLKPVQRRILYAMFSEGNTQDKGFRKSAKTVGNVIGNFHPHGDSSVYDAMVRLSQSWKMREPLIDMHGNNGSMDGDPPAAMRYTEARLSKIAAELLADIDKETVEFVLNFDDTTHEPTVLPARYPNLLVNGATGISAGYATDIPPHNIGEVIDASVHLISHPKATTQELMQFVKGPDFPTGGIIQGIAGLTAAYETGKGKIVVRSKTEIEEVRGGKQQIVITEIPYEVNKANLVRKMDEIRINRKIEGIAEVRDESDRTGLRIVIELKKETNAEGILTYFLKNTDLQVSYNLNMVAIDDKRPQQVGLKQIIEAYIGHKRQVILKRTEFLLRKDQKREHIVAGLIKAISILDEVIRVIRNSQNKADAKNNLITKYEFTEAQAEAIVSLQLYRLTNTDITQLRKEEAELQTRIKQYQEILDSSTKLNNVMKKELKETRKTYATDRLTTIQDEIEELTVDTEVLIAEEEVVVSVTKEGYLKRTSLRSYGASKPEEIGLREGDYPVFSEQMTTLQQIVIFTTKGNVINRPVHELPEIRWKDLGHHISQSIALAQDEKVLAVFKISAFSSQHRFVLITKNGFIKQTLATEYEPKRTYRSRAANGIKLKSDDDRLIAVYFLESENARDVFLVSNMGFGLKYPLDEVSVVGANAVGVKSIDLKKGDYVISGIVFEQDQKQYNALLVTQRGSVKKMNLIEFDTISRAKRGLHVLKELKKNPHRVNLLIDAKNNKESITIITDKQKEFTILPKDYKVSDRYNNGSFLLDETSDGVPVDFRYDQVVINESEN
ncbi:DNA topoisomerase IV subunit A [Marinilactibacillus psychrotolerans]|uniref:DNA topoisomerase 4 subunit A n=1 Tax=Marinilactibacillus psychrotolerans TaxID=191770 RepID=A0A511GYJ8_9LACT|nr:DNA topoisomerase IV subunit A [Marinilactibacillus psychrotolerans]TLQ06782.1 DNA topoisomerase IV subunit A [Marinilactibacillus psychrotolerans]GEL66342.1 DNA topoisomerase 4 subunit A [Marinilactibacillus psychrotolerans]GEQ34914.1 DNA topoisomerase IV subunit A [Marinilactibacillus psychrotolerans]SDC20953.1 topoisomerase-4 subunit A [Marinilactibacillus psychrotolerans]